jgi:hypothetical protein
MADEQRQIACPDRFVNEAGGARKKEERIEHEQNQRTLERAVGL